MSSTIDFPGRKHNRDVRFDDRLQFSLPDQTVPVELLFNTNHTSEWSVERDHSTDAVTLRTKTAITVDLPYGAVLRTQQAAKAGVTASNPQTVSVRTEMSAELSYAIETVRAVSTSRFPEMSPPLPQGHSR